MTRSIFLPLALIAPAVAFAPACKSQQVATAAASPTTCPPCPGGDGIVARIGSETITMAELDKAAANELFEARQKALDTLITERAITPEAKKVGMTAEAFVRKQVEAKVPPVTEKEAEEFFKGNQARLGPQFADKKFAEVKEMIVQGLTGQKRQEAVGGVLEEVRKKAGVKVLLSPPRVEVAAVGPARGPERAKVTIVEFSDFQCPYCSRGRKVIDDVVKAYGDKVRVVFRDFPLSFHEHAQKAAEAGLCAHEQGKFWAMHDWMFDHQSQLAVPELKGAAKTLGLDAAKFDTCLTTGKLASAVADNMKAGEKAGVRGTPAFFVNGVFLNGALPLEKFKEEIDRALAQ
jgi:protein-disulfide isomerase